MIVATPEEPAMDKSTIRLKHPDRFHVGGQWIKPSSDATFSVLNCATEETVATVAAAQDADVDRALAAARRAFDEGPWPRMSPQERAGYLARISEAFRQRNDEFARVWSIESGVVYSVARPRLGLFLSAAFRQYAEMAETFPFSEAHVSASGHEGLLQRDPVGVVVAIVPWNGPAGLMAYKAAPALLAGCSLILKSSPEAPCSAYLFAEICEEVGLPPGVVNVLTADRAESERLIRDPRVDKVTFTGSTAAGRRIASICGERVARVTLELGGKSPAIVLDDFDVEAAAATIGKGLFGYLSGQVCHGLTRVIVDRSRHDAMAEALAAVGRSMRIGDPFEPTTQVGPLASARQRASVERYVARGVRDGATLVSGGRAPAHLDRGFFFEPTVFADVDNGSAIAQEEIFGPVICVIPCDGEDHAVALANDTIYGLNASVFTHDEARMMAIARRIRSGSVGHNASRTDFSIGFGGFKQSGLGREGGIDGLQAFLEPKTIILDRPAAA
jgi:betaine-aldehyde dehydrogenase